ncbi:MAG: glycosyltransferase family 2 protein [Deltaproteobacteria bacterium]|nr:glycosyltransferase family 2 protein [Deltaproteobacteria bacterium]
MYRSLKIAAIAPVLDERHRIAEVVRRTPREVVDWLVVVDDGSSDGSGAVAGGLGAIVVRHPRRAGVGAAIRDGFREALARGADVVVVMAGNDKDAPEEIPALLDPIAAGRADFVQGSRYLGGGQALGDMPLHRRIATRAHPWLFSRVARRAVTESTNGFRAIHRRVLEDARLDLAPRWLDGYDLEPYLYLRAIQLGYRTTEVAVTKVYAPRAEGRQTKMRPVLDWWAMVRPLVFVGLGIRR